MGADTKIEWADDTVLVARFWSKVERLGADDCWPWRAGGTSGGYGTFTVRGVRTTAQRVSFALHHGHAAAGKVDHLCRNRACVNPAHLEDVTNRENTLRGLRGRLHTHCPQGHEFTAENTGRHAGTGQRFCRTCRRDRDRKRRDAAYWRERRRTHAG